MNRTQKNKKSTAADGMRATSLIVIAVFLILWAIGICLDEPARVLKQATQICLSCIGIG